MHSNISAPFNFRQTRIYKRCTYDRKNTVSQDVVLDLFTGWGHWGVLDKETCKVQVFPVGGPSVSSWIENLILEATRNVTWTAVNVLCAYIKTHEYSR